MDGLRSADATVIRAVVLDFDGVILESVDIKTQAFLHLFQDQPEDVRRRIVGLHREHGGISRAEKFAWIYRDLLRRDLHAAEAARLDAAFSRFCWDRILAAPFVKGAWEFLNRYHREYLLFVLSGTPETELREILEARGLTRYFRQVWGSPTGKADVCREILREYTLAPAAVAFVGDAVTDFDAARQTGVRFIARLDGSPDHPLERLQPDIRIPDLSTLHDVLAVPFRMPRA